MFQFPPCPPSGLCVQPAVPRYCLGGFPHSGISGSMLDDSSPKLIAAIHALLRLLAPRHPPHALSSLIHVRRQHLIRVDSSSSSAQLLRCQRLTPLQSPRRCGAGGRPGVPLRVARQSRNPQTKNYPAHHRAPRAVVKSPTPLQLTRSPSPAPNSTSPVTTTCSKWA